jgi:predicted kinase
LRERGPAVLVAVAGVVGTGKTTAAEVLADELEGVVISSDRVRKHLAGLRPDERSGAALGIYTEEWNERVYAGLLARARPVLASGRAAILDATWSEARQRVRLRALADGLGVGLRIVETRCAEATVRERLARRREQGGDASDAGPERYAASAEKFEPAAPAEAAVWHCVETDRPEWEGALRERARTWLAERA